MPNYKDTENKLHWLDDEAHEYLLPDGSVKITDKQAEKLKEPTSEQLQEAANSAALAYLSQTDWYVVRKTETGVEIPADILAKRQEARDSIK
jgi:hypothetical protein